MFTEEPDRWIGLCQTGKAVDSKEHFRQKNQHMQRHNMYRKLKGMCKESVRRTWRQSQSEYVLRSWHKGDREQWGLHIRSSCFNSKTGTTHNHVLQKDGISFAIGMCLLHPGLRWIWHLDTVSLTVQIPLQDREAFLHFSISSCLSTAVT